MYTKPKRVRAIRAWFFADRKLNMFKYTASYMVRKVKRREERGRMCKHECGRAKNAFGECLRRLLKIK
jgi:hypothetical protein